MAIMSSGFSLLLAISANPVKDFKCFTYLNYSGTFNFSLWIAEILVPLELEAKYCQWPQDKTRPKLLL